MRVVKFIEDNVKKYRELIVYVICGVLTTAVDYVVYWLLTRLLEVGKVPANIVGAAAAIVFAFFVNKWLVFRDEKSGFFGVLKQFIWFASMRVLSIVFQTACLWLFAEKIEWYDMAVKGVTSVVVVALNYVFSKLMIFKKKDKTE